MTHDSPDQNTALDSRLQWSSGTTGCRPGISEAEVPTRSELSQCSRRRPVSVAALAEEPISKAHRPEIVSEGRSMLRPRGGQRVNLTDYRLQAPQPGFVIPYVSDLKTRSFIRPQNFTVSADPWILGHGATAPTIVKCLISR